MPARKMLSLNLTVTLGMVGGPSGLSSPVAPGLTFWIAQFVVQDPLPRSTKMYSALALQPEPRAYSTPPPAAQPASVEVVTGWVEKFAWILPKAAPPVP